MFAVVLTEECVKAFKKKKALQKAKQKKHVQCTSSSSSKSSSDEEEIHVMDNFKAKLKKQCTKQCAVAYDMLSGKHELNESKHELKESLEEKFYNQTIEKLGETREAGHF